MSESRQGIKIKYIVPIFAGLLILLLFSSIGGGVQNVTPVEEEKALEYQTIGNEFGVNWQWILLIDMYQAQMIGKSDLTSQNPVITALNCLKVSIDVYKREEETDESGKTHKRWVYDHTECLSGAKEILHYFRLPSNITDAQQVSAKIQKKNSSRYRIKLEAFTDFNEVLEQFYKFPEEMIAEMNELLEANYFVELYGDVFGNINGDGIFGSGEIGDLTFPAIGMKIPLYLQYQAPWGTIKFGGKNIGSSGCSITSLAMVFSYLNSTTITPDQVAAWAGNRYYVGTAGQSWGIFPAAAKQWGVSCNGLGTNMTNVLSALSDGKPVIASMTPGTFTKSGHFIVLRGITNDGKILVNDPNDNSSSKNFFNRSFDVSLIKREAKQFWCFY